MTDTEKNIFELIKINPQRSKAFNWLMEHYEILNNDRNYWETIVKKLENLGIKNTNNCPYSTTQIKKIWLRVKKAKKREDTPKTTEPAGKTQSYQISNPTFDHPSGSLFSTYTRKEDTLSPEEITEGERRAAEETARMLIKLEERDKRR